MSRVRNDGQPWSLMWDAWEPIHDAWLRDRAGSRPVEQLARQISDEFGVPRTDKALRIRAKRLRISLWVQGLSMMDLERLFRVDHRVIARWWIKPGLLAGERWSGRGPNAGWWFEENNVEAFIRRYPWAYDVARMCPGHRLTQLASVLHRASPWVTRDQLARQLGYSDAKCTDRWFKKGLVPYERRYGAGGKGEIVIRARDLAEVIATIAPKRHVRRPPIRLFRRRCQCGARIIWSSREPAPDGCAFCGRVVQKRAA